MAKRFTDTDKWKKPFIKSLDPFHKLLWFYIIDDCDHAGIWHVDFEVAGVRVGKKINEAAVVKKFGDKITVFDGGTKWFIPGFIEFQYGELNSKNRAHESVIRILSKYGLLENKPLISPLQGRKDMDMDKELDMDMDKDKEGQKNESLLIPEMMAAWKKSHALYPDDKAKDTPSLQSIAKFISEKLQIPYNPGDSHCKNQILQSWEHLCDHIPKDSFFRNYSLTQVEKHIQSIVLSVQNGNSKAKSGSGKITSAGLNKAFTEFYK